MTNPPCGNSDPLKNPLTFQTSVYSAISYEPIILFWKFQVTSFKQIGVMVFQNIGLGTDTDTDTDTDTELFIDSDSERSNINLNYNLH